MASKDRLGTGHPAQISAISLSTKKHREAMETQLSPQMCCHNPLSSMEEEEEGGKPITSSLISCRMEGWSCMDLKSVPTTQHFSPACSSESFRTAMPSPVERPGSVASG